MTRKKIRLGINGLGRIGRHIFRLAADDNDIEIVLQCSHAFCKDCYRKWKERNDACPYCRSTNMPDINSEDIWTIEETDCLEELNKRLVDLETMIMGLLLVR